MIPVQELVNLARSAAMVTPGQSLPVESRLLAEVCEELLMLRRVHAGAAPAVTK